MLKKYTRTIAHTFFAGLIAFVVIAPSNTLAGVVPTVLDKSIGEWSAKWWQWALSIPASSNPMLDNNGSFCHVGQKGSVWFLAGIFSGGTVNRNCTVPNGKAILFPIANAFWINSAGDDPNNTESDYRQFAIDALPHPVGEDIEATLDGKPIIFNPRTPITRSQSPVFTATFPTDNIFGLDPSVLTGYPIVSDGFWVMLPPLSRGPHILHFQAGQSQDVTYHLTVGNR
jgi:hypothetical protein